MQGQELEVQNDISAYSKGECESLIASIDGGNSLNGGAELALQVDYLFLPPTPLLPFK